MVINNVEIKKGDYICGCAKDILGYHYLLAFAFKVDAVDDEKITCMFQGYSMDDGVAHYYEKRAEISKNNFVSMLYEDEAAIFSEEDYNKFVEVLKQEELGEDDYEFFNYFIEFWKSSIAPFYEMGYIFPQFRQ